jgi:hypothetical protein
MQICPKCRSNRVHRSRSRNLWEKIRRDFSHKRPFRCAACGWRGWGQETDSQFVSPQVDDPDTLPPDFEALDEAIARETSKPEGD